MAELPPSHGPASRAAALAAAYISHRHGSPGHGWVLRGVRRARREDIDGIGHKYHLEFVLEDIFEKDSTVNCTAEVLYHLGNRNSAPDVHFTIEGELKNTDEADNTFYNRIKSLKKELEAENIPDSYGNVPPEMEPIRALAWAASGYVIWQNSTENTKYQLAQIKHVKQVDSFIHFYNTPGLASHLIFKVGSITAMLLDLHQLHEFMKRTDEYLEFDYTILLHENVSQEIIPWQMTVLWHPQHGIEVTQNSHQPKHALD